MFRLPLLDRLSIRLTAAFLLAAILGVVLVAVLAYRSTSSDFSAFLRHMEDMGHMTGSMRVAEAAGDFLDNLGRTLWIAGLSGVALAIFLGSLLTRQIVAPLTKVAAAARRVAQGDLDQRVDIRGSGELAELGESFNLMAATLTHDRELRQNMVADIAHELRTPLSILQGNVEAMLDGILSMNSENLTSLHQEITLLTRLVEDLLRTCGSNRNVLDCGHELSAHPNRVETRAKDDPGNVDSFRHNRATAGVPFQDRCDGQRRYGDERYRQKA